MYIKMNIKNLFQYKTVFFVMFNGELEEKSPDM